MQQQWTPDGIRRFFYLAEVIFGGVLVGAYILFVRGRSQTGFKLREADRPDPNLYPPAGASAPKRLNAPDPLAEAKMRRNEPLRLTGIVIDGPPHRILGVSAQAGEAEITKAYRELMKRYHPDRVGRPGTREWQDAQKIAEAINSAKNQMLKALQSQSPRRSGR